MMIVLFFVKFWIKWIIKNIVKWIVKIDNNEVIKYLINKMSVIFLWFNIFDSGLNINWLIVKFIIVKDNVSCIFEIDELNVCWILGKDGLYILIVKGLNVVIMLSIMINILDKCLEFVVIIIIFLEKL